MRGERIRCVKEVLETTLNKITEEHPMRKVGLIDFSSNVEIIGDG